MKAIFYYVRRPLVELKDFVVTDFVKVVSELRTWTWLLVHHIRSNAPAVMPGSMEVFNQSMKLSYSAKLIHLELTYLLG